MRISEGIAATIPGTKVETRWVLVTPEMAKLYLLSNVSNRLVRSKHIDRIVSDMKEDRFFLTHQGVAFDEEGNLIDGQHRLTSIIESERGQWLLVTTGLPGVAKRVIDAGAKRAAHDFMPGKFKTLRAASIRLLLAVDYCGGEFTIGQLHFASQQVTSAAIQESWDDWDHMEVFCPAAVEAARNVATCGPASLLTAAMLYPETSVEFLDGLRNMTGLSPGDPRLALLKFRGGAKRVQTPTAAFVSIKCAKAMSRKRSISIVRYSATEKLKV